MPEQLVSRIVNEVSFQHGGSRVNTAGYRPRSAGVRPRSATASKDRRTMDANAHMFLATGMAEAGARRRNLALRSKALPSGRWRALRSQLQDGAKMMWSDVGAPWMYLEKAEEGYTGGFSQLNFAKAPHSDRFAGVAPDAGQAGGDGG